jgi:hypothetical protein
MVEAGRFDIPDYAEHRKRWVGEVEERKEEE